MGATGRALAGPGRVGDHRCVSGPYPVVVSADQRPAKPRVSRSVVDMLRSLAVVAVVVAVTIAITLRTGGASVRVVDYRSLAAQTAPFAPFPLLLPTPQPAGWVATSDYYDPPQVTGSAGVSDWQVGFVTSDHHFAGFDQTQASAAAALAVLFTDPQPSGSQAVNGRTWRRASDLATGARALVGRVGATTVVVHGTASWDQLGVLAASLGG